MLAGSVKTDPVYFWRNGFLCPYASDVHRCSMIGKSKAFHNSLFKEKIKTNNNKNEQQLQ